MFPCAKNAKLLYNLLLKWKHLAKETWKKQKPFWPKQLHIIAGPWSLLFKLWFAHYFELYFEICQPCLFAHLLFLFLLLTRIEKESIINGKYPFLGIRHIYIYVYIYIYIHTYIHIYIYIHTHPWIYSPIYLLIVVVEKTEVKYNYIGIL